MTLTRLIRHGWPLALLFATAPPAHAEPLRIGAEDDWYPYTALRDGQVQGMSVDIVKAAFAATSTDIELLPYPYARCMQLALKGAPASPGLAKALAVDALTLAPQGGHLAVLRAESLCAAVYDNGDGLIHATPAWRAVGLSADPEALRAAPAGQPVVMSWSWIGR